MTLPDRLRAELAGLPADEYRQACRELCEAGLLTCTRGTPGDDDAEYAVGWMPLDGEHPDEVRARHAANRRRLEDIRRARRE